ncbi:MAG TPA: hypothetical protein PLT26_07090 [Anaerolineaceae bacterium]|nr:hypothetical protein [Anaerolineaceae bacterium]HQH85457.1 hypothetical protein [Anaerolineaceae bacterium]
MASGTRYVVNTYLRGASVVAGINGNLLSETMYKPWGETHYSGGAVMPTDRLYTGQIKFPNKNQLNHKPAPDYKPEEIDHIPQDFYFGFEGLCQ